MTEEKKEGGPCQPKKEVHESLHDISCECYESEEQGHVCTCGAVKETEVREGKECADPWTSYERGEKGKGGGGKDARKEEKKE